MNVTELRKTADFHVRRDGRRGLLYPASDAAWDWLDERVAWEQWQWFGHALVIERRDLTRLLDCITADGLTWSL